jgi:arabinose-5-phosphate isomerase
MQKHIKQQIKIAEKTFRNYNFKTSMALVRDCVNTLNNGKQIVASALGKNEPICDKFVATLNSVGINCRFLHTHTAIHGDLGLIKKGDLVILLSKSGETAETVYLAKILKKWGTDNWLLTCKKNSTASKHIKNTLVLPIEKEGDPWNIMPFNSTLVFLIFLNALSLELIEKLNIQLSVLKTNHPGGSIGKVLRKN